MGQAGRRFHLSSALNGGIHFEREHAGSNESWAASEHARASQCSTGICKKERYRWAILSDTNAMIEEAKITCIRLNTQTPW